MSCKPIFKLPPRFGEETATHIQAYITTNNPGIPEVTEFLQEIMEADGTNIENAAATPVKIAVGRTTPPVRKSFRICRSPINFNVYVCSAKKFWTHAIY